MLPEESVGLGRRILIVEDDPYLANLVRQVLTDKGFDVAVALDAGEGYETALSFDPDQALLDVMLGEGPTGIDLAHSLRAKMPWVALVLVTNVLDLSAAGLATPPDGTGLVHKNRVTDPVILIEAMTMSLEGTGIPAVTSQSPFQHLTQTQVTILRLISQGWTNDAIAEMRGCTRSAVENRLNTVFRALEITNSAEFNRRAEAVRVFVNAVGPVSRADAPATLAMDTGFKALSSSQREILSLVAQGYSNEAIAARRLTTGSAVEKIVSRIYLTLGIDTDPNISRRAEAVRLYINTFGPMNRVGD